MDSVGTVEMMLYVLIDVLVLYAFYLDCCLRRHGVPGGSPRGSEPGPPGARRWPWSHHHLFLKKTKEKLSCPHPAHMGCCHGYQSPGIFGGRSQIWFLWRGRGWWKAGPLVIDRCLKDLRRKQLGLNQWLAESTSTVCVHAGPQCPCTWNIEHRDTLYCSFNSGNLVMFCYIFIFCLSLLCWCCQVTDTRCVKISKGGWCCWYQPCSLHVVWFTRLWERRSLDLGKTCTETTSYRTALCRKVTCNNTYWILNVKHSLVICMAYITICTKC